MPLQVSFGWYVSYNTQHLCYPETDSPIFVQFRVLTCTSPSYHSKAVAVSVKKVGKC